MADPKHSKNWLRLCAGAALAAGSVLAAHPASAQLGPTATAPYKLSVFATTANSYTQPDSIVQWGQHVLVGFQNGVAKDGTDGKSSTIVEYSLDGKVQRIFHVKGHNDGLRIVAGNDLWALQNEDANPNLVVINLKTETQATYTFPATPHGGGYDDMVLQRGAVYMSASNPNLNTQGVNVFPALVRASLQGNTVQVTPVVYGNASATNIATGAPVTLNLTDPDSMIADPRGNIVLDDQQDAELVFIQQAGSASPVLGMLPITTAGGPTTLDDTVFAPEDPQAFLLFSDVGANVVYKLESATFGFEPGIAYSASDTAGLVGTLDLDTGVVSPIVTGLVSARGMTFIPSAVPDKGP